MPLSKNEPTVMYTYVLFGVIQPERALMELHDPLRLDLSHPDADISGTLEIAIYKNQVTAVFATQKEIAELYTLRNVLGASISHITNSACVANVVSYEVELRAIRDVRGEHTIVFGADFPGLSIGEREARTTDIFPMLQVCGASALFSRALADFNNAIKYAADTGFFCYRAVESLLHDMAEQIKTKNKVVAISALNSALNLDPSCIEFLRSLGGEVRHGKVVWISGEQRKSGLKVTREILVRFADYHLAATGSKPKFDLLKP